MKENNKTEILAKVMNMGGMLSYQQGAVVSRTLIKKDNGTVTIFAFDKGESLSEHKTPFDAMVYIIEGEAEITISGNCNRVKSGEMIIMPANEPHALKASEKFKMLLIMIKS
jgi:quercetin dioxygenase-like cupin family protein